MKFILKGFFALTIGLMFTQCAGNNNAAPASAPAADATGSSNMKIAFVQSCTDVFFLLDHLLSHIVPEVVLCQQ